ncbi:hypothetical protein C4888_10995, partial [Streptococcus agalactiae]
MRPGVAERRSGEDHDGDAELGEESLGVFAARQQPGESGDEDPVCVDEDVGPPQALLIRQGAEGARLNGPQSAGEGLHEVRPQ